jgi:hypothetical protein
MGRRLRHNRLRVRASGGLVVLVLACAAPAVNGQAAAAPPACSSFGATWTRSYNARASKDGNPVRILAACCKPGATFGLNKCLITVTLVGTRDRGCESVVLNEKGNPVGPGIHESCTPSE